MLSTWSFSIPDGTDFFGHSFFYRMKIITEYQRQIIWDLLSIKLFDTEYG